jgi:uncharacterized protein YkwD
MASTKARVAGLLVTAVLLCALLIAPATASAAGKPGPRCKPTTTAAISALPRQAPIRRLARAAVCLINQRRVARGMRRLRLDPRLSKAATWHSHDMVHRHYFAHISQSGNDIVDRLRRTRYIKRGFSWMVGENLAWGSGSRGAPLAIVKGWMASPPHRRNMLNPRYREIGIGVLVGGPQRTDLPAATYTTTFGFRRR